MYNLIKKGNIMYCLYCGDKASQGTQFCSRSCVEKFTNGDWD
jgi:predicted nucleic acid-binding Zn ribbon protein